MSLYVSLVDSFLFVIVFSVKFSDSLEQQLDNGFL